MSHADYLTPDQLSRALNMRDLTDPAQGGHAVQVLLDAVVSALQTEWGSTVRYVRNSPIVPVRENYDRLGYDAGDVTRARRYTRYISPTVMLRRHTSAELPVALEDYAGRTGVDELIVAPGLVYRRDVVDRSHVGEPHQVDLWRRPAGRRPHGHLGPGQRDPQQDLPRRARGAGDGGDLSAAGETKRNS
ncbi:hypothetical protein OU415_08700 [Saccharopolyspora sp. WRP15-2]|uniref:Phenylalanyl-tRNA synthetase domain-containing protein n=1 Tax=Saccharopolyspora oryzae TaxID=2997343 RepID=A0ABT4UUV9_9PSEU|nr:hypothetical protein [Saccharopolyspora oryzae]MDA3625514.1 hypothetical protein [Saccharopolyspora oryzae]